MIKPRLNHQIRSAEVRVVEPSLGVMTHAAAMQAAQDAGADLIEISANATPPVCIIKEWGKWKFEQSKKEKAVRAQQRASAAASEIKQVQIRPVTDVGDMETKARQVNEFLEEGHKVRLVCRLRGRELAHETEAQDKLDELIGMCNCTVEQRSGLDNRQIVALVVPRKVVETKR